MKPVDFKFSFPPMSGSMQVATLFSNAKHLDLQFNVSVDDTELAGLERNPLPSHFADAVDIGIAVWIADRLAPNIADLPRLIQIELPVRNPAFLESPEVAEELSSILYKFTQDEWSFRFKLRNSPGRFAENQVSLLQSRREGNSVEVALWSGGLDALAGLYSRVKVPSKADSYRLIGTGSNQFILKTQREVLKSLRKSGIPNPYGIEQSQVNIAYSGTSSITKNRAPRARGFVFLLIGSVCAALEGQCQLYIYENGLGAINLPFRKSETGLDHSRAVNPALLRRLSPLTSTLLGLNFSYVNPFEFSTKAQVCEEIAMSQNLRLIAETITCDRRRRETTMQCGCCSSCLLRRQALAVHGIVEPHTRYAVTNNAALAERLDRLGISHLQAMLSQVEDLRQDLASPSPWASLENRYAELVDIAEAVACSDGLARASVEEALVGMYGSYVSEWDRARLLLK